MRATRHGGIVHERQRHACTIRRPIRKQTTRDVFMLDSTLCVERGPPRHGKHHRAHHLLLCDSFGQLFASTAVHPIYGPLQQPDVLRQRICSTIDDYTWMRLSWVGDDA